MYVIVFFFFQAEDGIRDPLVTGVQTCALPISLSPITPSWRIVSVWTLGLRLCARSSLRCGIESAWNWRNADENAARSGGVAGGVSSNQAARKSKAVRSPEARRSANATPRRTGSVSFFAQASDFTTT